MPDKINPFASLTITYLIGSAITAVIFFAMTGGGNIAHEWTKINWTTVLLGIVIVGLEAGSLYMYKAGWNINTASIMKSGFIAVGLLIVGYLMYNEEITPTKVGGVAAMLVGLYLLNK